MINIFSLNKDYIYGLILAFTVCETSMANDISHNIIKEHNHNSSSHGVDFPASYLLIEPQIIAANKTQLFNTREKDTSALKLLITEADKLLNLTPPSIAHKTELPPSKNPNDYMSVGPYWWPDSTKSSGKPWIRKDGEVNPITRNKSNDKAQLRAFTHAVKVLSYAYYFTDNIKYAKKAEDILVVWFVNTTTRMNPNFNFAQAIPGRVDGRGIGIIELADMPNVLDALYLLKDQLSPENKWVIKAWFQELYHWMKTSKNGMDESKARNNHGSFYHYIMLSLSTSLAKKEESFTYIINTEKLIEQQINDSGEQPLELERTKPYHYSIYNLRALYSTAKVAEQYNRNLWHFPTLEKSKLKAGLDYLIRLSPIDGQENQWRALQKFPVELERLVSLFSISALAFPGYTEHPIALPASSKVNQQFAFCNLLFSPIEYKDMNKPEKLKLCIL